jgi:tRNA-binding protein
MEQNFIKFDDFQKVDIRIGIIEKAEPFPEARRPAFKLYLDFGPDLGKLKSSAQITENYKLEDLPGKKILAVINFPSKQIGPFMSEALVLGVPDSDGYVVLVCPDKDAPIGGRLY